MSNEEKKYDLYILIKDKKPVYIGVTCNIKRRIIDHRRNKDIDTYYILKTYKNKKDALLVENSILKLLALFGNEDQWINYLPWQEALYSEQKGYKRKI